MGKFLETKYSNHQSRLIKKCGKLIQKGDEHKNKLKRKQCGEKDQEPPLKKLKTKLENEDHVILDSSIQIKTEFQDLEIELIRNTAKNKVFIKLVNQDEDLFSDDELKARFDQYTKFNFIRQIFDEIALEGLDGITIEALWKRFNISLKCLTCLDYVKEYIWQIICSNDNIYFYELPEPRKELVIFNRDAFLDKDTNIFKEVYQMGEDIYSVEVQTKNYTTWGSCSTLSTRVDISECVRKMSLDLAHSRYKNKLVMVAEEKLRKNALFDDLTDPNYEFTPTAYCILERIGRSREIGEITQGPAALGHCFNIDSKSIYHYCKRFNKQNLVTKQFFCVRSVIDQNKIGRLLHLSRFYTVKKTKYMILTESIVNYLKKCPGYKAPYSEVKSLFTGYVHPKFFKNSEFLKYVNTSLRIPYKELYPDSTFHQYMTKSLEKERVIQVMQLKDPFLNIAACWSDNQQADLSENDDDDDEEEIDDDPKTGSSRISNKEFIREIYLFVHSKGKAGCTIVDIRKAFEADFHTIRTVLKKLVLRKLLTTKKCDIGRQKYFVYVATCLLDNPNRPLGQSIPDPAKKFSSVIERLKPKHKQIIESPVKEKEQFDTDRQGYLLGLGKPTLSPIKSNVPQILCGYLISTLDVSCDTKKIEFAEIKLALKPFKIRLSFPIVDSVTIQLEQFSQSCELQQFDISSLRANSENLIVNKFKPDYSTKAFLLMAHIDRKMNRKKILEILCPTAEKSKKNVEGKLIKGIKIGKPLSGTSHEKVVMSGQPFYMGSNPVLVFEDNDNGCVSEMVLSTSPTSYKTGNITNYVSSDDSLTDRALSRINYILDILNTSIVFEECYKLLKVIVNKEQAEGYDKRIDRKSLQRILKRLVDEGYIKIYKWTITNKKITKTQIFICHPDVDHTHEMIKNGIEQTKFKFFCSGKRDLEVTEPAKKKQKLEEKEISPFAEHDVLQSIHEIKQLRTDTKMIAIKSISSKKVGKLYGFRPKFARMSLVHEVLFYLIYVLDKDTQALPKEEVMELFGNYKIKLTDEDLENLPPVYCREISWKMFIPPLPQHLGWDQGWALLCDVILRIPLSLMVRIYCINFLSTDLQETLQHPIKRFFLLKNLPVQIKYILMYKRKCIHDFHALAVRLAYCGLVQFGPLRYKEKDQGFIYLNRNASLLETMTSDPGYNKVSKKNYNKVSFRFDNMDAVKKYWFTMHNICMNTPLHAKHIVQGKTITLIDVSAKPSLNKSTALKKWDEVEKYDTGEIPGDQRGAAGLDSALWAHMPKNWFYFALKSPQKFRDELASLKLDQSFTDSGPFDQLKLPPLPNKFYISKINKQVKQMPSRKIPSKKTSKKMPIIHKLVPRPKRSSKNNRNHHDSVDKAILRKFMGVRFKPSWTEEEDKILFLMKLASKFLRPSQSKPVVNYFVMRDILHRLSPESQNKLSKAIPRRFRVLNRDLPFLTNINSLLLNVLKLPIISQYFVPLRNHLLNEKDATGQPFKLSETEMNNAFIFFMSYLIKHHQEVVTALFGSFITIDYLNEENLNYTLTRLEPIDKETKYYWNPSSEEDIRKFVLKNIFQSALGHKDEHPAWSYQMYKIYQRFSQDVLKDTLQELREQHMIQSRKEALRKFFTPYKFSLPYIYSQTTTFTDETMEIAHRTFSELRSDWKKIKFTSEDVQNKKFGQLFGLNEVLSFMWDKVNLKFIFPEYHLILNPNIEDHSEVVDELAKRYHAKMKCYVKDVELQNIDQAETEPTEIPEPEPSTSSVKLEEIDIMHFDEDEPLNLSITSTESMTISNLKHWISDCIDAERVRSPSPELLNLDVAHEYPETKSSDLEQKIKKVVYSERIDVKMLTLEEIKKEMMELKPNSEQRRVPYITDLTKLLTEHFEGIRMDDEKLIRLKSHFIPQYPQLKEFDINGLNEHFLVDYIDNKSAYRECWLRAEREAYVYDPSPNSEALDDILAMGGNPEDVNLASELISFVYKKDTFGATGPEIKEHFVDLVSGCTLESIVKILTDRNILLRTGVCSITFIHHEFRYAWLTDTFVLTDEHVNLFKKKSNETKNPQLEEDIDKSITNAQWIKIKSSPWINVDGTLDKKLFKLWLSSVLSYCTENPNSYFSSLCDKFCYLKPVDLFYLVEILENLGCLEMRFVPSQKVDLFSEYELNEDRKATFLDELDEICLETNQISFVKFGSFLNNM